MNQRYGLLSISLLFASATMMVWAALAAKGFEGADYKDWLGFWGSIGGAIIQLAAAIVAARIVWQQLREQQVQASIQVMDKIEKYLQEIRQEIGQIETICSDLAVVAGSLDAITLESAVGDFSTDLSEALESLQEKVIHYLSADANEVRGVWMSAHHDDGDRDMFFKRTEDLDILVVDLINRANEFDNTARALGKMRAPLSQWSSEFQQSILNSDLSAQIDPFFTDGYRYRDALITSQLALKKALINARARAGF